MIWHHNCNGHFFIKGPSEETHQSEMNVQMEESSDSYKNDLTGQSSPASNLYYMSADELIGMEVVVNDAEDIGHLSSIV